MEDSYTNIRADQSGSIEFLKPNSSSNQGESKIQDISNSSYVINVSSNNNSTNFLNPEKSFNNSDIKKILKTEEKIPEIIEKENIIEIKRDKNTIGFFIKAKGEQVIYYQENINTKIKEPIEKYINAKNLEENIKYKFWYKDNPIENLENTISDLRIETLHFVIEK